MRLSSTDRNLLAATSGGLPLDPDPYGDVARRVGCDRQTVLARFEALLRSGAIRRIGLIPNHYALGVVANGMSVWDIADEAIDRIGVMVGELPFVSHCYRRPRHMPIWPYNLFAMAHGRTRAEVLAKVEEISRLIGPASRGHEVLFSKRILKKSGLQMPGGRAAV